MNSDKPIEQAFCELMVALQKWGMSATSIRNYYYEGICTIRTYYQDFDAAFYDEALTDHIADTVCQKYADGILSKCICFSTQKVANMLKQYDGDFSWQHREREPNIILSSDYYSNLLREYQSYEERIGIRSSTTIKCDVSLLRYFFSWLEFQKCNTMQELTLKDVVKYLTLFGESKPSTISKMICALRKLHEFVNRSNISSIDFLPALTSRPAPRQKLMPVITEQGVEEILNAINVTTPTGKRDYAMIMLAKELGVRGGDICSLKFTDMCWESNEIKFNQGKTKAEVALPLEPLVGNAIADYILNGRPETDAPHIFVRARSPHKKLSGANYLFRKYAPFDKFEKNSGFHSFRRGVASKLLNAGIDADTVKGVLGQVKIDSLKPYARISGVRLKSCAMNLSGIETSREALQ